MGDALGTKSEAEIPQTCIFYFSLEAWDFTNQWVMSRELHPSFIYSLWLCSSRHEHQVLLFLQFQPVRLVKLSQALLYCICRWVTKEKPVSGFLVRTTSASI